MSISIEEKITELHCGDQYQLNVIFSNAKRIIVEAPAGYGKTATMVSRIAYLFTMGAIPNPQKILALTFSVNTALKIKRDIAEKLPILIQEENNPIDIGEKVFVTNYHGFCKSVLKKYGFILSPLLKRDINLFCTIDDDSFDEHDDLRILDQSDINFLRFVGIKIKRSVLPELDEIEKYNRIVYEKLLPLDKITYTSIILMTIELLQKHSHIRLFYQRYYSFIVVDEFQDTNCIAWKLLTILICEKTQILFLGDSLQRIYGFIGAVPEIMEIACRDLNAEKIVLEKNYRFKDNYQMLLLDRNLRLNASSIFNPTIHENALLETFWAMSQSQEAEKIVQKIMELQGNGEESKIAILFRGRGQNSDVFEQTMIENNIAFFNGMFTDDDSEYIAFHAFCKKEFLKLFGKNNFVGKKALIHFSKLVSKTYVSTNKRMADSLNTLLEAFIKKVNTDYANLSAEDKFALIIDTFENRQLKQAMEYVASNIIMTTIHGAKGLEWSYVFLPDLERWGLPSYFTCKECVNRYSASVKAACPLPSLEAMNVNAMLDELSVFYVAVTRARKQLFVSASAKRANDKSGCMSCMSRLPGVSVINAER